MTWEYLRPYHMATNVRTSGEWSSSLSISSITILPSLPYTIDTKGEQSEITTAINHCWRCQGSSVCCRLGFAPAIEVSICIQVDLNSLIIIIPTMPSDMNEEELRCAAYTHTVQHIRQITVTFITIISMLLMLLNTNIPEPYHMSILSGQGWVNELLENHPERIRCELGVSWEVFLQLITLLHGFGFGDLKYVQLKEQLAIFHNMSITGPTIWHTGECFPCSNKTISKYFCWMLRIFSSEPFYTAYINLPDMDDPPSWKIHLNPKMWPFFEHALGTLDGTHILCSPPLYNEPSYWNWKGFVSQNCLFTCYFDCQFVFGYTRWEGSATDVQVLEAGLKAGFG